MPAFYMILKSEKQKYMYVTGFDVISGKDLLHSNAGVTNRLRGSGKLYTYIT